MAESDRSRKALEFQLKMKTLEIEAALDTAEETRKKIVELTSEKQKVDIKCFSIINLTSKGVGRPDCKSLDAQAQCQAF